MGNGLDPRRAEPGQVFGFTDREGNQKTIKADDEGVVHPDNAEEVAALDAFDLPVARKALSEEKAEAKTAAKSAGPKKEG